MSCSGAFWRFPRGRPILAAMSNRWRFLAVALLVVGASGAIGSDGAAGDRDAARDQGKPKIRLVAEPAVGFTPVTTVLTGHLLNVMPRDPGFCHPAVTWVRINPRMREENATRYHEDAACRHPPEEAVAVTSFTRTLTLDEPGPYLFKVIVDTADGRHVESAYTRVEVLRVQ